MWWVLSSFHLLFDFAARPPHVFFLVLHARRLPLHAFARVLLAHPLLVAVAQGEQTLILLEDIL
jgi:hypothetical protein